MPREKARKPRRLLRERGLRSGDVRSFTPFSIHRKTWYSNVTHIRGSVIAMQKARRRPGDFPGIKFTIADSGLGKEIVGRVWSWGNPMAVVGNRSWTRRSLNFKKREERKKKRKIERKGWIQMKNWLIIYSLLIILVSTRIDVFDFIFLIRFWCSMSW